MERETRIEGDKGRGINLEKPLLHLSLLLLVFPSLLLSVSLCLCGIAVVSKSGDSI
jgi:hypothetical protein